MLTFKDKITEAYIANDYNQLKALISKYKKEKEILNPEYKQLVDSARRLFGKDSDATRESVRKALFGSDRPDIVDLYYAWPYDSLIGLSKLEKTMKKVKINDNSSNEVVVAAKGLIDRWKQIADDLKSFKTKVVKVTAKRAEAKKEQEKVLKSKFADSSSLIKIFESHLEEYKNMARKRAKEFIDDKLKELEKAGWDLDKVAPLQNSYSSRWGGGYEQARAKRSLYTSLTKSVKSSRSFKDPDIRKPDKMMIERYIEIAVKGAETSYRAFMQKMIEKIGKPVVKAKMTGNIWTNAVLNVTTSDGENQVWNTKMIINFSKYQKMFNQFPSRRKS